MIKFSTETGQGLSMFENEAIQMIKAMGMSGNVPGAVKGENVAEALESLKASVDSESESGAKEPMDDAEESKSVDLSTRAFPLIELLARSVESKEAVMWEHE